MGSKIKLSCETNNCCSIKDSVLDDTGPLIEYRILDTPAVWFGSTWESIYAEGRNAKCRFPNTRAAGWEEVLSGIDRKIKLSCETITAAVSRTRCSMRRAGWLILTLDQSQPMASLQTDMGCLYLAVCDKPGVDCSLKSKPSTPF